MCNQCGQTRCCCSSPTRYGGPTIDCIGLETNTPYDAVIEQLALFMCDIEFEDGQGIDHVSFTSTTGEGQGEPGETDTYTVWGDFDETINLGSFTVTNGANGTDGVGISNIAWTSNSGGQPQGTQGTTDTYTITLTDASTYNFIVTNGADGADWTLGVSHIDIGDGVSPFVIQEDGAALNRIIVIDEVVPPATVPGITEFTSQLSPAEGDINEVINMESSTTINIRPNNANCTIGVWAATGYIEAVGTGQAIQFGGSSPKKGLAIEMKCISVNGSDVIWLITNHTWNGVDPVIV